MVRERSPVCTCIFPQDYVKSILRVQHLLQGGSMEEKNDWLEEPPWLAVNDSDVDETLRYSLDEIRIY